ncbi:MAG: hypothetical protein SNF33_05910 [Candidatus Algichlamydia australiensis]|nr:hypothetical protein [Chlamydiales bacterium]
MASTLPVQGSETQNYVVYKTNEELKGVRFVAQNFLIMPGACLSLTESEVQCRNFICLGRLIEDSSKFIISGKHLFAFNGSFEELANIMQFTPEERLKASQKFYPGGGS